MIRAVHCDRPSFKAVEFGPGLNVVLADRTKEATKKDTRNGLGKSTLLEIIHFCLGGNPTRDGLASKQLLDWTFTVELELAGESASLSRNTKTKGHVTVKGDTAGWPIQPRLNETSSEHEMPIRDLTDVLGSLMFGLPVGTSGEKHPPTFRGLISYFVRRGRDAYSTPFEHYRKQREVEKQVFNAFLLGLEWRDANELQGLKDKKVLLDGLKRAAEAGLVGEVLGSLGELQAKRVRLENAFARQSEDLKSFQVHPQYRDIEIQADELTTKIHELENSIVADTGLLTSYEQSIESEIPPSSDDVLQVYEQAGVSFPDAIKKRLDDVKSFHEKLITNRATFLATEIKRLRGSLDSRQTASARLSDERAALMKVLQTHRALEEYTGLQRRAQETNAQLKDVERRIADLKRFAQGKSALAVEQEMLLQRARQDLDERQVQRNRAIELFNANSEALYQAPGNLLIDFKPAGFELGVKIERSGSQGIDSMKVFCYDLMLAQLWSKNPRSPGFLIHDSTIFDPVDERQRALALELADREAREHGFQYICALNSDMIPWKDFSPGFDLNDFVRLRLTDATDDGCLLGIRF
jgi:uncharacterized protein YydD (DUF2326 family)